MKTFLLPICLSISLAGLSFAAGHHPGPANASPKPAESPAPADASTKPAGDAAMITLKNKSSFQVDAAARNPFWPIGWKPTARVAGGAGGGSDQGEVPPGAFLVTSITLDGATHFAIINGKTMGEGQQFGLQVGTQVYQVVVKRIEDGRVIIGRHDEEIAVPLRRKEAPEHPPEGATRSPSPSPK